MRHRAQTARTGMVRNISLALAGLILIGALALVLHRTGAEETNSQAGAEELGSSSSAPTPTEIDKPNPSETISAPSEEDTKSSTPEPATPEPSYSSVEEGPTEQPPVSSDPSPDKSGTSRAVAASKEGVTVREPTPKASGDGMWVPVEITNLGETSASYAVEIRITGANGFTATIRTTTSVLEPGATASQAHTALDASGSPAPARAMVKIEDVSRTSE